MFLALLSMEHFRFECPQSSLWQGNGFSFPDRIGDHSQVKHIDLLVQMNELVDLRFAWLACCEPLLLVWVPHKRISSRGHIFQGYWQQPLLRRPVEEVASIECVQIPFPARGPVTVTIDQCLVPGQDP